MQTLIPEAFARTTSLTFSQVAPELLATLEACFERDVEDFREILRQPSISATGEGMPEAASQLLAYFHKLGMKAELIGEDLGGYPTVFAEISGVRPEYVIVYGHYDVQPPDPLEAWEYPPFSATRIGDRIYARGSVDDKGNFFCAIKAVENYLRAGIPLPIGVRFLLEGEEEIGSRHLEDIVKAHRDQFDAVALLACDGNIPVEGRSELVLGTKGMLYVELASQEAPKDLHSGKAPIIENPAWRLIQALATLRGKDGTSRIPGFYEAIETPSSMDLQIVMETGLSDEELAKEIGVRHFRQQLAGPELKKALYFDPTCNISGLTSGYQGPGSKTVLPAVATAKLDIRLVPGQDPRVVLQSLKTYLRDQGFADIDIQSGEGIPAGKTKTESFIAQCAYRTLMDVYGQPPVVKPIIEGSGPGYIFSEVLQLPWAWIRLGPPENRMHAPNEYTTLKAFRQGIETMIYILNNLGTMIGSEAHVALD